VYVVVAGANDSSGETTAADETEVASCCSARLGDLVPTLGSDVVTVSCPAVGS